MSPIDRDIVAAEIVKTLPFLMHKMASDLRFCGSGILPSHFRLLGSLVKGPCTLSELAERQGVSLATMSNTVGVMVERGWINRLQDVEDRRKVVLTLSPRGCEVSEEIHARIKSSMGELISSLSDDEVIEVTHAFTSIRRVLEENGYVVSFGTIPEPPHFK